MQLTLIRHGEAKPPVSGNDIQRTLTNKGHLQAKETANFLKKIINQPDILIVSPLLRAQETLSYLEEIYPGVPIQICDFIKPDDDAGEAIEWLSNLTAENIVVVCHMNVIGYMDEKLTNGSFHPFHLAEARVYQQAVVAQGLSTLTHSFIPQIGD